MISLIAAAGLDGVIGKDNRMPWDKIKIDINHFINMTEGNTVVMGRKTWESLSIKPLPDRVNVVLSKDPTFNPKGAKVARDVVDVMLNHRNGNVFVIGGATVYRQFMDFADYIFLTRIFHHFDGDTYFPAIKKDQWEIKRQVDIGTDKAPYDLSFIVFGRTHHH